MIEISLHLGELFFGFLEPLIFFLGGKAGAPDVIQVGSYFGAKLREAFGTHPLVGEVRSVGMLAALEFMADKETRKPFDPALKVGPQVSAAALQRGVIARAMPHGDILGFAPPLVTTRAEVDEIVKLTKLAVDEVASQVLKQTAAA